MTKRIYAKDYGILPDRYMNSLDAINRMLSSINGNDEEVIIEFESGKYMLSYQEATSRELYISNTTSEKEQKSKTHLVGVQLSDKKNIVINGNNSLFAINGAMIMLMLEKCYNITFKDMAFDYVRPTVSQMVVDKATLTTLECTLSADSKYKIIDGDICFVGDNFEEKKAYRTLIYDKAKNRTYKSSYSPIKGASSVSEIAPYKIKISSLPRTTLEKIGQGTIFEVRNNIKNAVGVFIAKSKNIRFEHVAFHYMHGLGIVGQLSKDLSFDKVTCAPRRETDRYNSAFSDMMHFSMCNGKIAIRDCKFSGAGADAINVHGAYLIVKQRISDRRILLEFEGPATYGIDAFKVGDDIEGIDTITYGLQWANKVKKVTPVDKTHIMVDLVTPFDGIKQGQAVENVSKTASVDIEGCVFDNIPSSAILVTTRRPVKIMRNKFDNIASSAIYIAGDTSKWYESGKVMDMTIEKNEFINCGFDSGKAAIDIAPRNLVSTSKAKVHKNINIIDNRFVLEKTSAVSAKATANIRLIGNRYEGDTASKPLYKFSSCKDVELDHEDYTNGFSKMSCLLMDKKKDVSIK